MPTNKGTLANTPWRAGVSQFGKSIKAAFSLKESEDFIWGLDGTKSRRGGQEHVHRVPFREGQVFAEHFLDSDLKLREWKGVIGASTDIDPDLLGFTFPEPSVMRGSFPIGLNRKLTHDLYDPDGVTESMPTLVQTLSTDLAIAETEALVIPISFRLKLTDLPAPPEEFSITIEPGTDPEWFLFTSFSSSGLFVTTESGTTEISAITGVTNPFAVADSTDFLDTEWHNWRYDIRRIADTVGPIRHYLMDVYFEEDLIFGDVEIQTSLVPPRVARVDLIWNPDAFSSDALDVEIDHIDIDAQIQRIDSYVPFRIPQDEIVTKISRAAVFAGSRAYMDNGDHFHFQNIDTGLEIGSPREAIVFNGKLIYPSGGREPRKLRIFTLGDQKSVELSEAPPVTILRVHANRIWGTGNPLDPSRVYFSEQNSSTLWAEVDGGGSFQVEPNDGQRATGLGPSFHGDLVIYKGQGIYRITGTSPLNFALDQIHAGVIGCVSHRTIKNVGNDQYFVSKFGVHSLVTTQRFGDLERAFLSRDIRGFWDANVIQTSLDQLADAAHDERQDRYRVLLPTVLDTAGEFNRVATLHYALRSEEFPAGEWSIQKLTGGTIEAVERPGLLQERVFIGGADGFLNIQDQKQAFDFPVFAA